MILDEIVENKKKEVEDLKKILPLEVLKEEIKKKDDRPRDLYNTLNQSGIRLIAEIKKASPSAGDIQVGVDIEERAKIYESAGAAAISVLTDNKYFKGDLGFIQRIKNVTTIPVLRKDFIIDPYQVYESKYYRADAILLIVSILNEDLLVELIGLAHELGMKCLLEIHNEADIEKAIKTKAEIIGINARDLKTFEVDINRIVELSAKIPDSKIIVGESGIRNVADVEFLKKAGITRLLVGTSIMKSDDPGQTIAELINV